MNLRLLFIVIIFLGIVQINFAQDLEQQFQAILDSNYQAHKNAVGFMIHVESPDNNISWTSAVGFTDKEESMKLDKDQPLLIASNTKTYISATILRLVEKGKFDLDQAIKNLVPRKTKRLLKNAGYDINKITVRHLLSHTSGISDHVDKSYFVFVNENPKYQWTRKEQIALAMKKAAPVEAGTTYSYADINYLLLTEIIERSAKKHFYKAVRELLDFEKHQLDDTWFVNLERRPTQALSFPNQYSSKFTVNSSQINPSWDLYGGGGQATTAKDLARFFQLLFNGEIVKDREVLAQMHTKVITEGEAINYCLGLFNLPSFFGTNVYYHGGFWGTDVVYIPSLNTSIAIFTLVREKRDINIQINSAIIDLIKSESKNRE